MEKETKTVLVTVGASFAAGVAVTLTVLALCFCPMKQTRGVHGGVPHAGIMQQFSGQWNGERGKMYPRHQGKNFDKGHRNNAKGDRFRHERQGFHPGQQMKSRFAQKLGLSEEQKAQIEKFRQEDMAKMAPLFKQMDELRAEADKLREENRQHFESVLTAEQKEILKSMHEKHFGKKGNKQGKHAGNQQPTAEPEDVSGTPEPRL